MGWRIIEINKNCHIKLFLDNLIISGSEKVTIPISNIDLILFTNNRTNVSINTLNKLANNNVVCVFCDEYYKPTSQLIPLIGNNLTIAIFSKQVNWSKSFKDVNWRIITKQKITNQKKLLEHFDICEKPKIEQLSFYINDILDGDPNNREGHAAKLYWFELFGREFKRSDDTNIINSILNFGYTILNNMISRSIVKKGLDPRISLFHKSVWNHYALSSDIIEPFRIVVDIFVYILYKEKIIINGYMTLTREIKQSLIDFIANYRLKINGYFQYLNNAIDIFIDNLINDELLELSLEYEVDTKINEGSDEL